MSRKEEEREEALIYAGRWLSFSSPEETVEARTIEEVRPALKRLEELVEGAGLHAAGFIAYEAAPAFDPALRTRPPDHFFPLLRFALFRRIAEGRLPPPGPEEMPDWTPSLGEPDYRRAIAAVRGRIERGDTYQVNFTYRLFAPFRGDGRALFRRMVDHQGTECGTYLDAGRYRILSASPELFFRLDGEEITVRPMKGTARRGRTPGEDRKLARRLRNSPKNRAENLMTVDMLRNDLGRISETGSVRTGPLFEIEPYPTLFQMTSTVAARTTAPLPEILAALFPCASVTGAPKPSTMGIIAELETTPRRIYTGAIGLISPGRKATFSVAIRTVLIDRETAMAEYGVGGGIVWDSRPGAEFAECRVKAMIVAGNRPAFSLLETIGWTPEGGHFLLERHLERLRSSAARFGYPVDIAQARRLLLDRAPDRGAGPRRVRLLAGPDGALSRREEPLPPEPERRPRVALAASPIDSRDPLLRHKTTRREIYENARAELPGFDDLILWNERGEITESTVANVVVGRAGELVTPPAASGLLPGTLRAELLESGRIRESSVTREELLQARRVYLINSVRGWRRVAVAEPAASPRNRRRFQRPRPSG